jgi:putative hemolysin
MDKNTTYGLIAIALIVVIGAAWLMMGGSKGSPNATPTPVPHTPTPIPVHTGTPLGHNNCTTVADCPPGAARCLNGICTALDEHGCIPTAGFVWCEQKHRCIRPTVENCTGLPTSPTPATGGLGLPNPASVYCSDMNYTLVGGDCMFPPNNCGASAGANCINGTVTHCEQWAFFRGQCGKEFSFCEKNGFRLENRTVDMGTSTAEYAVCVFTDGSECLEQSYLAGTCRQGQCLSWDERVGGCVPGG